MVDVQIDFDAGERRDPADKAGLASVTADMTGKGIAARRRRAGAGRKPAGEAWADLGAGFGGSAGADRMSFTCAR
jgi:zinc protease